MPASDKPTMPKGVQALRPVTHQSVAYTGTAGVITNAITSSVVRIVLTTNGYIAFGTAPTATTSGIYMVANIPEYFRSLPGDKVSAIQVASGGTLHVTECD